MVSELRKQVDGFILKGVFLFEIFGIKNLRYTRDNISGHRNGHLKKIKTPSVSDCVGVQIFRVLKYKRRLLFNITPWALYPGLGDPKPIAQGAGLAQEAVWLFSEKRKTLALAGI